MKILRSALVAGFCFLFANFANAQTTPEETIEVKGSVGKEVVAKWTPGDVFVLKNITAVKTAYEGMKKPLTELGKAVAEVDTFKDPKKKPPGIRSDRDFVKGKDRAEKKYKEKLAAHEDAVKKFRDVLEANKGEKVDLNAKLQFTTKAPKSAVFYFSISRDGRGYVWFKKPDRNGKVDFGIGDKVPDLTFAPKPEPPKN